VVDKSPVAPNLYNVHSLIANFSEMENFVPNHRANLITKHRAETWRIMLHLTNRQCHQLDLAVSMLLFRVYQGTKRDANVCAWSPGTGASGINVIRWVTRQ